MTTANDKARKFLPGNAEKAPGKKLTFKQQMMIAREQAVIETVNKLLATKGYDAMTVDEVADEVGIAKASLYRHFPSKEQLAVAAMVSMIELAVDYINAIDADLSPLAKLKAVTHWAMRLKLQGEMPNLPSQNSILREQLMNSEAYMNGLMQISDVMGAWIESAQQQGELKSDIPAIVVLYARTCDPVLDFLQQSQLYDDDQIIALVSQTCFEGLHD